MIKALLLIFRPVATWEGIVAAQRRWVSLLIGYLLPMLLLVAVVEGYGLMHFGKMRGQIPHLTLFSPSETIFYETAQFLLSLIIVFLAAHLIKSLGETFHGRHTFNQTFTVAVYALSPLFLLRLFDMFTGMSPWFTWIVGIALSIATLYHGLPRVMLPDPPHALGLYLSSSVLLLLVTGLTRFITAWYLAGKFPRLDALTAHFLTH